MNESDIQRIMIWIFWYVPLKTIVWLDKTIWLLWNIVHEYYGPLYFMVAFNLFWSLKDPVPLLKFSVDFFFHKKQLENQIHYHLKKCGVLFKDF